MGPGVGNVVLGCVAHSRNQKSCGGRNRMTGCIGSVQGENSEAPGKVVT